MKRKIFSLALALVFVLTGAMVFSACGKEGVNLHNKTYTLSYNPEWSYIVKEGDVETEITDTEAWLNEHWDEMVASNQELASVSKENYINDAQMKITNKENNDGRTLLAGAKIVIGKEQKQSESVHTSRFDCELNSENIYSRTIKTDTFNKDRHQASLNDSSSIEASEFSFKLTDYKGTTINNIFVKFVYRDSNDNPHYYSSVAEHIINYGSDSIKSFIVRATVNLASVSNN